MFPKVFDNMETCSDMDWSCSLLYRDRMSLSSCALRGHLRANVGSWTNPRTLHEAWNSFALSDLHMITGFVWYNGPRKAKRFRVTVSMSCFADENAAKNPECSSLMTCTNDSLVPSLDLFTIMKSLANLSPNLDTGDHEIPKVHDEVLWSWIYTS